MWAWCLGVAAFGSATVVPLVAAERAGSAFLALAGLGYAVGLGGALQRRSAEREYAARVARGSAPSWSLLKVEAVELIDDDWPGQVRVRLVDADGRAATFVGKIPIFFEDLTSAAPLPAPGHIRCWVRGFALTSSGRQLVVSTAIDGVASEDGRDEFHVRPDQIEAPHGVWAGS
ncbi:hypothetical protein [Catellatospora chokoriensis]|uniref:Uncharacterized protein n=1 Tax=Catellatospora chokoriensis TaxID=310353 RepID=A0A8J3K354_9ACTN|nr:hypothetical protein [Catellatospora chokoriensis]GIF92221.1 hypothetical protein Cch02nite_56650 [Catellatospora chokoriensis]